MSVMFYTFLLLSFHLVNGDCPLSNYPRSTVLGYIHAQIINDPALHNSPLQFSYPLDTPFSDDPIDLAISIISISFTNNDRINFNVQKQQSFDTDQIKFRVELLDEKAGWEFLRFSFLATQSNLFQMNGFQASQFSRGLEEGSYGIYRRLPSISNYSVEIVVKVFISGVNLEGRSLNTAEYEKLKRQYNNFKTFSTNQKLLQYFDEALVEYRGLSLSISKEGVVGDFLAFNVNTNSVLRELYYTYVIFSNKALNEKHRQVNGNFYLLNSAYEFKPLENMGMLLAGLTSFTVPRNTDFSFQLTFDEMNSKGVFGTSTSHDFLAFGFSYLALEIQENYVCSDCPQSRIIYQNFCLDECPRSYSLVLGDVYDSCQLCNIENLKVIDTKTLECVCAKRSYEKNTTHCEMCRYDCLTCQNQNSCLTCDNSLQQTKRTLSNNGRCVCPSQGYFDQEQNINCQRCHHSCKTCDGPLPHNCLTCDSDKELDEFGHCVCKLSFVLNDDGKCTCIPPVFADGECVTTSVNCTQNQIQTQVGLGKKCVCKDGYIQVLNECIRCGENQIFNRENVKCECTNKTVAVDGKCVACGNNQVFSSETNKCVCSGNTFESESGRECIKCPAKMSYEGGKCQCIFNFYEASPGVCKRCEKKEDGPRCRTVIIDV